jgi:hypothetical protein
MYSDQQMGLAGDVQNMGAEMWNWAQGQMSNISSAVQNYLGFTEQTMMDSFSWARDMRDQWQQDVQPQLDSLFKDAETYASKEEEMRQRGQAIQDVKSGGDAARASHERNLLSYGVETGDLRAQSLDLQSRIAENAMASLAANTAGERTKEIGRGLRDKAIAAGDRYLNEAQGGYTTGANVGISGVNALTAGTQASAMAGQSPLPFYDSASGYGATAADITNTGYDQQLAYAKDQREAESDMSGIGNLAAWGASKIPKIGPVISAGMKVYKGANAKGANAAEGGPVSAPGGPTSDGGAMMVSDGEYVIPADVVRRLGTNHFDKMIEKETGRPPPSQKNALPVPRGR